MAAPEEEAARDDLQQERVDDPDREAREVHVARQRRRLDLVVETALAPRVRRDDAPEALAEAELRRVDVAAGPVHGARAEERLGLGRDGLGRLGREDARGLHHRPGVGRVLRVVADLHLDRRVPRVRRGDALGPDEEREPALRELDEPPAVEVLDRHERAVGHHAHGGLGGDLGRDRQREHHEPAQVRVGVAQLARPVGRVADERRGVEREGLRQLARDARARAELVRVGDERIGRAEVELLLPALLLLRDRRALGRLRAAALRLGQELRARHPRVVPEQRQPREQAREAHLRGRAHLGRDRRVEVELLRPAALVVGRNLHLRAERQQLRGGVLHLQEAAPVDRVRRDRRVRPPVEDVLDRRGHQAARAHLEEDPVAVLVHLQHGLGEADGQRPALGRVVALVPRLARDPVGDSARVDLADGLVADPLARELLDRRHDLPAPGRVERTVQRDLRRPHAAVRERAHRLLLEVRRDRVGALPRREVERQHHLVLRERRDRGIGLPGVAHDDRDHRRLGQARVVDRLVHDAVDVADRAHALGPRRVLAGRARAHHRREVAARAADDARGLEPEALQQARHRRAAGEGRHERLRVRAGAEDVRVAPVVRRRREDEVRGREVVEARQRLLELVEGRAALGVEDHEVAHHVRVERHHARVDEGELPPPLAQEAVAEVVGAAAVAQPRHAARLQARGRGDEPRAQVRERRGDDGHDRRAAREAAGVGDVQERDVGDAVDEPHDALHLRRERGRVRRGDDDELGSGRL